MADFAFKTKMGRYAFAGMVCTSALIAANPAFAQVQEIIVTAQKIEENVQDVPISVSVVTGAQLEQSGTRSLEDIGALVPSVTFRRGTTNANSAIVLRGVGTISFSIAAEPSVSTVVDGVVLSRSGQSFLDLVDLDRIEVLRGPQGTLFGKNASAGLINIVSKGGTDTLQAETIVSGSTDDEYRARLSVSGPIAENLSTRITGYYGNFDGNIRNINANVNRKVNGYEHYGFRGILDYDDGSSKLRLIADAFRGDDDCCAEVTGVSRGPILDAELGFPTARGEDQRTINQDLATQTRDRQLSLTASGDFDVGESHTLSLIAGYRNWKNTEIREGDFLPRATTTAGQLHDIGTVVTDQYSGEIRFASRTDQTIAYQVGAFIWRSENTQDFTRRNITCATSTLAIDPRTGARPCNVTDLTRTLFPTATSRSDVTFDNYAVFGQVTANLAERFRLIAGLRFTRDELEFTHVRARGINAATGLPATGPGVSGNPAGGTIAAGGNGTNLSSGSTSNNNFSGRAVAQFDAAEDVMLYASYTRGYKGPAFNVFFNHTAPNNSVPIQAETSNSYEAGVKSQFFDRKVQMNASVFYVEYDGFQANNFVLLNGATVTNLTNAGTVRSQGFELDSVFAPVDGLNFRANFAYADAQVKRFNPNPLTNAPDARNGTQLPLAPKFSYTLGADYKMPVGSLLLYLGSDYRHVSQQFSDLGEVGRVAAFGIWNANIGLSDADDRYRVTLSVRNILDDSYIQLSDAPGTRLLIPRDADRFASLTFRAKLY